MQENFKIRPYSDNDRIEIRKICCDTADLGRPVESFFSDRDIFADLITSYYTDFEPESVFVAEVDNRLAGYLLGCLNTKRYIYITAFFILPVIIIKALFRGTFFKKNTIEMFRLIIKSWQAGGFKRKMPLAKYPAHLHIDIKQDFRRKGLGRKLMEKFLFKAKEAKVKGVHLSTREDNAQACVFFERCGFVRVDSYPMFFPSNGEAVAGRTVIYAKTL